MESIVFSVSQLTAYIKGLFSADTLLQSIFVHGEISNYKLHSSGHSYFTLKDECSKIRCVMFKQYGQPVFDMQDGLEVLAYGYVNVYDRDGQYQLYVTDVEPFGIGSMHLAFEQLKQKLDDEGLFDPRYKKSLPLLPKRIGVVTSDSGAAVRDILNVVKRRYPNMDIVIASAAVQGKAASVQIAEAIEALNMMPNPVDVIIVGRGGGSAEELWPFNEEIVARSIHNSRIPVISAVGHEIDFTIADMVADKRASTPSVAAEMAVPVKMELQENIISLCNRMEHAIDIIVQRKQDRLSALKSNRAIAYPRHLIIDKYQHIDQLTRYLFVNLGHKVKLEKAQYENIKYRLEAFSPLSALKRGYAMVFNANSNELIKSVRKISIGQEVCIVFNDGQIKALTTDVTIN